MKALKLISLFFVLTSAYSFFASASCTLTDFQRYSDQTYANRANSFRLLAESLVIPSRSEAESTFHSEMEQCSSSNSDYRGAEKFMAQQSIHSVYSAKLNEISNLEERKACLLSFAHEFSELARYSQLINQTFSVAPGNRLDMARRVVASRDWTAFLQTKIFEYAQLGTASDSDKRLISAQITPLYRAFLPLVRYVAPNPFDSISVAEMADLVRYVNLIEAQFGRANMSFEEFATMDGDWVKFIAGRVERHRGTLLQPLYEIDLRNFMDSWSRRALARL